MQFIKRNWGLLIPFLLSVIIISPIFHAGFFPMHDDTQPSRVFEMAKALRDGMFPVRLVHDLGYGYGYPIFNFYSPLPYYIGGIVSLFRVDALAATKVMMALPVFFAALSMFIFIRSILGQMPAIVASVIYILFPYYAVNIFVRGAVGESYAYAFLPLVFYGLLQMHYDAGKKGVNFLWVGITGIFLTLVILSHNLTAFVTGMITNFFVIISLFFSRSKKFLAISFSLTFLIAVLLSAFYALPAVFEMRYTNVQSQIGGGADYKDHFICPMQLWSSPWGFGGSTKTCVDGMSFRIGKSNIILAIAGIIIGFYAIHIKTYKEKRFIYYFSIALLLFSIIMTTELSKSVWETLPFMSFLQFPWRFLNFVSLAIAVISGLLIYFIQTLWRRNIAIVCAVIVILITLVMNVKLFSPQRYHDRDATLYTNEKNLQFTISRISDEYMPRDFEKPNNINDVPSTPIEIMKGQGSLEIKQDTTSHLVAYVTIPSPSAIRVHKAYFPSWIVSVDNKEAEYTIDKKGYVLMLPSGEHSIDFSFVQTPIQNTANILSLTGIALLLAGIIYIKLRLI